MSATEPKDLHERLCGLKDLHGDKMVCLVAKDEKSADVIVDSVIEYDSEGYAYCVKGCIRANIGYAKCNKNCKCHCHKPQ